MNAKYELVLRPDLPEEELKKANGFPKSAPGSPEFSVIVGGDGTFLKNCHETNTKKILLGREGSVAFYKALDLKDVDDEKFWERLEKREYKTTKLPMLEIEVSSNKGKETYYAVNDVAIRGTTNDRGYEFDIFPERTAAAKIKADGMIFSTPQASAAYNGSACGKTIELSNYYVVTSALAYSGHYSEVFDGKDETRLVAKGKMQIAIDGSTPFLDELECVELKVKMSDKFVELVTLEDFSVLARAKEIKNRETHG